MSVVGLKKMAWCFSQNLAVWRPRGKESCTGALAASAVTDHRTTGTFKPCPKLNHQLLRLGDLADACLLHIATLQPNLSGPVTAMQKTRISSPDTLSTCHPQWMEKITFLKFISMIFSLRVSIKVLLQSGKLTNSACALHQTIFYKPNNHFTQLSTDWIIMSAVTLHWVYSISCPSLKEKKKKHDSWQPTHTPPQMTPASETSSHYVLKIHYLLCMVSLSPNTCSGVDLHVNSPTVHHVVLQRSLIFSVALIPSWASRDKIGW